MNWINGLISGVKARGSRSTSMVLLAACGIGILTGLSVFAVQAYVVWIQRATLGFAAERRVAIPDHSSLWRIGLALTIGSLVLSGVSWLLKRYTAKAPSDAVEANALRGGFLTWTDGFAVVVPILLSVAVGASVGIEAAVTQIGAVLASVLGRRMKMPRSELRLLVAAGAAAAISAAYHAPIAGMLYAYELILGSYNRKTLVPVASSAVLALMVVQLLGEPTRPFMLRQGASAVWVDYPVAVVVGVAAALLGIATMVLVGGFERVLARLAKRESVRRLIAAAGLTLLAAGFPAVLGSGHAAIDAAVNGDIAGRAALGLLGAKALASSLSIGGGFRGGLFSASLLLGSLLGQVSAWMSDYLPWVPVANPVLCALVGMAAVGASIIGSPLAMAFLVLETTGDYDAMVVVAIGTVTAAYVTERLFGYSFATWRFQQRGLAVDGGHDVSRMSTQSIADLVRPAKVVITPDQSLRDVAQAVSTAGHKGVAVVDRSGKLLGLIDPTLLEIVEGEEDLPITAADLVGRPDVRLGPDTSLADAVDLFRRDDRFVLPVVDRRDPDRLTGTVRSSDVFKRAVAVANEQRADDLGIELRAVP